MDMKRIIAMLMMAVVIAGTMVEAEAKDRNVRSGEVISLIRNYNLEEGFEVVSVGNLGLGLAKMVARIAAESEEEKAVVNLMTGLNKVLVVEYEDASQEKKDSFNAKISKLLTEAEKIIEVKDDGETVNIYGTSADDGETIDDLMIFIPEESTLVCLFGSISSKAVADVMAASNKS